MTDRQEGNVSDSAQNGELAAKLAKRAQANFARADKFEKLASEAEAQATASLERAREIDRELAQLEIADPEEVRTRYLKRLDEEHAAGRIDGVQYREGLKLAREAEEAFRLVEKRNKWLIAGAVVAAVAFLLWLFT